MMGLMPGDLARVFDGLAVPPLAIGANCGVGASDILVSVLEMQACGHPIVSKGNCGVPKFEGTEIGDVKVRSGSTGWAAFGLLPTHFVRRRPQRGRGR